MLPYVAQMPKELLGPDPSVISQLLASIWHGWEVAGTQGAARAAAAECYVECLTWTISRSPDVSPCLQSEARTGQLHAFCPRNIRDGISAVGDGIF